MEQVEKVGPQHLRVGSQAFRDARVPGSHQKSPRRLLPPPVSPFLDFTRHAGRSSEVRRSYCASPFIAESSEPPARFKLKSCMHPLLHAPQSATPKLRLTLALASVRPSAADSRRRVIPGM